MADRDAWKKAESLSKIFAAVLIPVVLGVASLLANQALEKSKTRDELLKQAIDVVFLFKSDQMAGADKTFESRSPFKPTGYYTSSRWAGGLAISGKVFISYRRSDSAGYAGRVWDRLERDLGRHSLFMDVAAIPLGTNFPKVLHEEVAKCDVLLAMIGPNWLDARDDLGPLADVSLAEAEHKNRRLDDPNDYVRIEIAQALQRGIPVIPILLDSATIPKADQLPEDLKELASRNGMHIHHASFHDDMNRLIRELKTGGLAISGKVFISYRRSDSAAYAGRVWDRLERDLGRDFLFMDVDAIPLGANFPTVLHEEVAKCSVLLAVIGPNWLLVDEHGNRRLDDPNDWMRVEIAAALQRNIPVIPILLDGAKIPRADQLPEDLKELASRQGMHILHASFHDDMNRLVRELKGHLDQAGSSDEQTAADAQQSDPAVAQGAHSLKVLRGQRIRRHDLPSARRAGFQTKPEPPMGGKS
jgi:hypothetical protein